MLATSAFSAFLQINTELTLQYFIKTKRKISIHAQIYSFLRYMQWFLKFDKICKNEYKCSLISKCPQHVQVLCRSTYLQANYCTVYPGDYKIIKMDLKQNSSRNVHFCRTLSVPIIQLLFTHLFSEKAFVTNGEIISTIKSLYCTPK